MKFRVERIKFDFSFAVFRLGFDDMLEVMQEDDPSDEQKSGNENGGNDDMSDSDDDDYEKKSDTAEDFSDITELAEDLQTAMAPERSTVDDGDDYEDIESAIPASTVKLDGDSNDNVDSGESSKSSSEQKSVDNDKELMPPPSIPLKTQSR